MEESEVNGFDGIIRSGTRWVGTLGPVGGVCTGDGGVPGRWSKSKVVTRVTTLVWDVRVCTSKVPTSGSRSRYSCLFSGLSGVSMVPGGC